MLVDEVRQYWLLRTTRVNRSPFGVPWLFQPQKRLLPRSGRDASRKWSTECDRQFDDEWRDDHHRLIYRDIVPFGVRRQDGDREPVTPFNDKWASPFFSHPNWWTAYFYYYQTMIRKLPGAYSDHLWIPAPSISTLRDSCLADFSEAAHFYAYYLKGSIERIAMMFELDESKEGPSAAEEVRLLDTLIPTFEDENERACFEEWIKTHWDVFLDRCEQQTRSRRVPRNLSGSTNRYESIERHTRESTTVVDLLEEYREHMRNGDM